MASDEASNDGKGERASSAIRYEIGDDIVVSVSAEEAKLILEWAWDCSTPHVRAELLDLFDLKDLERALKLERKCLH